jgi:hypothetical protein
MSDQLPWNKREIIDAMIAEYQPFDLEKPETWPLLSQLRALIRLAIAGRGPTGFGVGLTDRLSEKGDISPLEDAVYARLARVWQALHRGRDPEIAYEIEREDVSGLRLLDAFLQRRKQGGDD